MPKFSKESLQRLETCDQRLQYLMKEIIKYYDCTIITGHRDEETQQQMYNSVPKRSKVQWPNSKHNSLPSKAIDVAPWPIPHKWGEDWKDRVKFYELKAIIFYEAEKLNIKIRYGGDWDMDMDYKDNKFDDLVHFEILE